MWYVYIIRSKKKKWYYVGSTNRIKERLEEHNNKKVQSTKSFVPFEMVFTKEFIVESEARAFEKMLKQKRVAKEEIIRQIESK